MEYVNYDSREALNSCIPGTASQMQDLRLLDSSYRILCTSSVSFLLTSQKWTEPLSIGLTSRFFYLSQEMNYHQKWLQQYPPSQNWLQYYHYLPFQYQRLPNFQLRQHHPPLEVQVHQHICQPKKAISRQNHGINVMPQCSKKR